MLLSSPRWPVAVTPHLHLKNIYMIKKKVFLCRMSSKKGNGLFPPSDTHLKMLKLSFFVLVLVVMWVMQKYIH